MVIGWRSRSNKKIFSPNLYFCVLIFHYDLLKGQGHLKVKVKFTQYQNQIKEINFLSNVNVFVIYVLHEWYTFNWKVFLFVNNLEPINLKSNTVMGCLFYLREISK